MFDYMNADADTLNWDEGVNLAYLGKAGMTIVGDWAKGYLINAGWKAGVDFGEVPMPGTVGTFVFTTDTFGLPKGAPQSGGHHRSVDHLRLDRGAGRLQSGQGIHPLPVRYRQGQIRHHFADNHR